MGFRNAITLTIIQQSLFSHVLPGNMELLLYIYTFPKREYGDVHLPYPLKYTLFIYYSQLNSSVVHCNLPDFTHSIFGYLLDPLLSVRNDCII